MKEKNNERDLELYREFEERMNGEFDQYRQEILSGSKDEIFDKSYEITIRRELKDFILKVARVVYEDEARAIYSSKDILELCYNNWQNSEKSLQIDIENSAFDTIGEVIRKGKRKNEDER